MQFFTWLDPIWSALDPRRRRTANTAGRAHIELKEPPAERRSAFASDLEASLREVPGVVSARVACGIGRAIVTLRPEADLAQAIACVEAVERRYGLDAFGFARPPEYPGDLAPIVRVAVELGADAAAFSMAALGRLLAWPTFPLEIDFAATVGVLRNAPRVRAIVEGLLGSATSELALGVAGALAQGLTQSPFGPIVDASYRALIAGELIARRRVWTAREGELGEAASSSAGSFGREITARGAARPVPLPGGPIEDYAEKALFGSLGAFGMGMAATGSLAAASATLVGGAPRPAHVGRQAFAAWLDRMLAARGVLSLDPSVLRLLDRVDTVVVDGTTLLGGAPEVAEIIPIGGRPASLIAERLWSLFGPETSLRVVGRDGWSLGPAAALGVAIPQDLQQSSTISLERSAELLALVSEDRLEALVRTQVAAAPEVAALLRAIREAGLQLKVVADDALAGRFPGECVIDPLTSGGLASVVRDLQSAGHVVCLVAGGPASALRAADCAISIRRDAHPSWDAHLVGNASLDDARILIDACTAARSASMQSVTIAEAAAGVGFLLAFGSLRWQTTPRVMAAVDLASLVALLNGVRVAAGISTDISNAGKTRTPWHSLDCASALARLASSEEGLTREEAARRRVGEVRSTSRLARYSLAALEELASPLTPLLGAAAAVSAAVGSITDAVMVAGVVAFDAVVGALQKVGTADAVAQLSRREQRAVRVLREGREWTCDAGELVAGDVIRLEVGDVVPADCRVLRAEGLEVDESSLTGESLPVAKSPEPSFAAVLAERTSMLYEGSAVVSGRGRALVVATGKETEAQLATRDHGAPPASGVELRLQSLLDFTTPLALGSGAVLALNGLVRGRSLQEVVGSAVGLAVAAVPEGLPLVSTMAQLAAARRLADRGALVQNVRAIEALGRVDLVCVDKTGTMTEGRIEVREVSDGDLTEEIGALTAHGRGVLEVALRATPLEVHGRPLPHFTDRALVESAQRAGIARAAREPFQVLAELAFDPTRAFHAVLGRTSEGFQLCVKGAPEVLLPRCTSWVRRGERVALDAVLREQLEGAAHRLARRGLRVLAVAERATASNGALDDSRVAELTLRGFVALADAVRPTAPASVAALQSAGVRVVMMTGDHPSTAECIAAELGLPLPNGVLTGAEIDRLSDEEIDARLASASVLARLTPAHKVRLVHAYQRLGHVVGMTGDGINDAPAIRLAHVGIALGARATSAARTAADLVITDDRIETLVDAVLEGRAMWGSVRDAISLLVGGNLGEMLFIVSSAILSGASPLNARQLLLVNLLTDAAPAIAIALRPPSRFSPADLLAEGPEASLGQALDREILWRALSTAAGTTGAWLAARPLGSRRAGTVAFATLVTAQLGQTLALGGMSPLVAATSFGSFALTAAIVQTPGLSGLFGCTPLGPIEWGIVLAGTAASTAASIVLPRLLPGAVDWIPFGRWAADESSSSTARAAAAATARSARPDDQAEERAARIRSQAIG